jgi:hypothetical protein
MNWLARRHCNADESSRDAFLQHTRGWSHAKVSLLLSRAAQHIVRMTIVAGRETAPLAGAALAHVLQQGVE